MQPLISTHFFLQKLTFFCCSGISRIFWIFCCSVPSLLPFFSPFSLPNTSVEGTQSKTFLIFQRCQVCTSCQPINTFKLSNHCPAHSVKRDCINLLNVHWNRQLQWWECEQPRTRGRRNWRLIWTSLCSWGNEMSYHIQSLFTIKWYCIWRWHAVFDQAWE